MYFWNTLNKTHQGILVWNRNNRLHTLYKKHVHKERKEITHGKIGERTIITTSNVYISTSTWFAITTWSQDPRYMNNVSKLERKEKDTSNPHYILQNMNTPLKKISYSNPPPMCMNTLISKLVPIFVMSDKR